MDNDQRKEAPLKFLGTLGPVVSCAIPASMEMVFMHLEVLLE